MDSRAVAGVAPDSEEGLHGYMGNAQTVFPQSVNLATTWNTNLAQETGAAIAAKSQLPMAWI